MSVIGTLAVNIVAKTERFTKGIDRAMSSLSRLSGGLAKATKLMTGFAAAGAAAGAGALTVLTKSQFTTIDAMAKFSDKIGISIDKLAAFRLAAEETGVAAGTLDMALQRMTRRIAEAGVGKGEALGALGELGLNARMMAALKPEEQFLRIADAMNKVGNQGDRVRLAMRLFDSEGVALVNTLKLGSAGLREYDGIARRLGLTISRELAASVEKANDAIGRLKMAFVGLGRQLAVRVAPLVEKASKFMESFLTDDGRIHKFADAIARGIGSAIELVLRGMERVKKLVLETSVLFRQAWSEMLANPYVVDRLMKMGLTEKTIGTMASRNSKSLFDAQSELFRMNLAEKGGNTLADKFAKWYGKHLDAAMKAAQPQVENIFAKHFAAIAGKGAALGTAARGTLLDILRDPFMGGRLGRLAAGMAGDKSPAAAAAMGQRGTLAFAVSGSADSYRQQAAIRKQNEPMLQFAKRQTKLLEEIRDDGRKRDKPDPVANF